MIKVFLEKKWEEMEKKRYLQKVVTLIRRRFLWRIDGDPDQTSISVAYDLYLKYLPITLLFSFFFFRGWGRGGGLGRGRG